MKWLNNVFERQKEAEAKHHAIKGRRVVFGAPRASVVHSSEALADMGLIGVYVEEDGDEREV